MPDSSASPDSIRALDVGFADSLASSSRQQWLKDYVALVEATRDALPEVFASPEFQRRLWEDSPISGSGMSSVPMNDVIHSAVAGNVGSMTAFAVGSEDAEWVATALSKFPGQIRPSDLTNLPKYTACCRLLIDGLPSQPFSIRTLPPPDVAEDRAEIVRQLSRRQYGRTIATLPNGLRRSPPKIGSVASPTDAG